ncbi:AMP-binding protein [Fodinicola feengrottensis]|uniref:AMP-binding protein n=1 Tax=Fodinicola feengrottensis TaxID=435914 RepID=UPI0013D42757|nr:AMP-binding protein [Fodinicola feengrottensis]
MNDDEPGSNLADLVREVAHRSPDQAALTFGEQSLTWAQLDAAVDAAAAAFTGELDLRAGDRVAIALPNGLDFPVAYFGALRAGLTALPVNPSYTGRELSWILTDSAASALIGTGSVIDTVTGLDEPPPALRHRITAGQGLAELINSGRGKPVPAAGGGEDLAVLMYTSGTSGRPKGAMLSHRALLANLDQCASIQPAVLQTDDVVLLVVPMFHIFGLNPGLGMVARTGCSAVLMERFDPVGSLKAIQERGITNVIGAPPMFLAWSLLPELAECFSGVRLAVSGAAPLDQAAQRRLLDATGQHVFEGYGLTETAPVLSSTLMCEVPKPGSIGRELPGVELRLVDPAGRDVGDDEDDDDEDLVPGGDEPGEIVVRGQHLFSGYWPDGAGGPDSQGWWSTGDVAYRDDDGDLFLVDRIKELILVSGFNVYPREIEDVLLGHPSIEEAAVLGVDHPYTGQAVKAYVVVLAEGATLTADEVEQFCARSLARFKCPTAVDFVSTLPHSATGKVAKARLREPADN